MARRERERLNDPATVYEFLKPEHQVTRPKKTKGSVPAPVAPRRAEVALYSTVTGERIEDTATLDAGHWYCNIRQPVLFEDPVRALAAAGRRTGGTAELRRKTVRAVAGHGMPRYLCVCTLNRQRGWARQ